MSTARQHFCRQEVSEGVSSHMASELLLIFIIYARQLDGSNWNHISGQDPPMDVSSSMPCPFARFYGGAFI